MSADTPRDPAPTGAASGGAATSTALGGAASGGGGVAAGAGSGGPAVAGGGSRELILDRVRAALRDAPVVPGAPREYRPAGTDTADLEVLIDRLVDYKAEVHRVGSSEVAATAARLAGEGGAVLVPPGLPEEWRPDGAYADDGLTPDRIAAAGAVLTAAAVAVAETGTIVLDASPDQGRRIISLLPDVHVCVLRPDQVVASVPDAVARLDPHRPLTWISGPSATSDIELNRVEGVHGPRHLHVLILDA